MSVRRPSDGTDTVDMLPTPSVSLVIEDVSAADTVTNWLPGSSTNKAQSMPNLADDSQEQSDEHGNMECVTSDTAARPVVIATDVNSTSLITPVTSTSLSKSTTSTTTATTATNSRMNRAASFVERPVITAVSSV